MQKYKKLAHRVVFPFELRLENVVKKIEKKKEKRFLSHNKSTDSRFT